MTAHKKRQRGRRLAEDPDVGEKATGSKTQRSYLTNVDYLPSDYSALQIINLDEFTEAAGVVVVGCLSVTKGLEERRQKAKNN